MNKKMRILAALAAAVIAVSASAMLSGCGGNNKDGDKKATTVPAITAQAATKAAESSSANGNNGSGSAAQNNDSQGNQASNGDSRDNNNGNNEVVEKHGNITREEAGEIALSNVPYGQTITICTPGTYNGQECWEVGIADTTGKVYEVYVSSVFCEYNLAAQTDNPDLQPDAHADDFASTN